MRHAQKILEKAGRLPPLIEGRTKTTIKPEPTTARPADPPPPPKPEASKALPPAGIRYPNGDVMCQIHNDRIDRCVCTVRSFRQPRKCGGCQFFKRG
jgi:hypothetical protein